MRRSWCAALAPTGLFLETGIAFHFLAENGRCKEGIQFTARTVLRIGVALLGVQISVKLLIGLGPAFIALVVAGVILTILFGHVAEMEMSAVTIVEHLNVEDTQR